MKRATKWWQMFSRKNCSIPPGLGKGADATYFALGLVASQGMCPRNLLFEQLFGHFLVAEALDFCTDAG